MPSPQPTATQLLEAAADGDRAAFDALYALLYDDLRGRAHRHRQRWGGDYSMDSVALVSEAYSKLIGQDGLALKSRAHFLAVAAKAMRSVLLDYAKWKNAAKRPSPRDRVSFDGVNGLFDADRSLWDEQADVLIALNEALERLKQLDERQSQVVVCRFFGGMTIHDTAEALDISVATVNRDWTMAKAWLYGELKPLQGG